MHAYTNFQLIKDNVCFMHVMDDAWPVQRPQLSKVTLILPTALQLVALSQQGCQTNLFPVHIIYLLEK